MVVCVRSYVGMCMGAVVCVCSCGCVCLVVWSYVFGCGVVWLFAVCSASQVFHEEAPLDEWLQLPGKAAAKQASVSIMLRTALFPHNRARLMNTTPSPIPVFQALSTAFREVLASHRFVLPTMDEVVSCETPTLSSV